MTHGSCQTYVCFWTDRILEEKWCCMLYCCRTVANRREGGTTGTTAPQEGRARRLELELIQTQMTNDTETNGAGRSGNARALRKQSKCGMIQEGEGHWPKSLEKLQKARNLWVLRTPQNNKEEGARAKKFVTCGTRGSLGRDQSVPFRDQSVPFSAQGAYCSAPEP